jgi:hypothetical protein
MAVYMNAKVTSHLQFLCEALLAVGLDYDDFEPKMKERKGKMPEPVFDDNSSNYYECAGISIGESGFKDPGEGDGFTTTKTLHLDLQYEEPFLEVDSRICARLIKIIDKLRGDQPKKRPFFEHDIRDFR